MLRFSLDWIELRALHESYIAKSMYGWFLVVPVLANLLSKIENTTAEITVFNHKFPIQIELPFTWWLLYLGALLIVLSNIAYQLSCPTIIKDHKTFRSFLGDRKDIEHLIEYRDKAFALETTLGEEWQDSEFEDPEAGNVRDKFWKLHRHGKLSNKIVRIFATVCFYSSLICVAIIARQNIRSVFGV